MKKRTNYFLIPSHFKLMLSRESPHVRESKIVLESGFNAVGSRFHGTRFRVQCQWNLDSEF